jgi:capsular polysaccharide biosynthesis protein
MNFFSGVPSFTGYALARLAGGSVRREKTVISLRSVFDTNYYHVLIETLARLPILDRYLPRNIPIVISPALERQPYFQSLCSLPWLRDRNWIVQHDFYVAADTVWICGLTRPTRPVLEAFAKLMVPDVPTATSNRRIFLTRAPARGRTLSNFAELLPVIEAYNLEVVDTEQLSMPKQITLFSESSLIVGIHGAGLTNTVFRCGRPLRLLELYPPHDADPGFYLLSQDLGHSWDYLVGYGATSKERHANFSVDPVALKRKLESLEQAA